MPNITLYHASPSRSSIGLWMLEELGEPYDIKFLKLSAGDNLKPDYLVPLTKPEDSTRAIARWWRERWLMRRVESADVLADVAKHTLVYPITHGAKVVLPPLGNAGDDG